MQTNETFGNCLRRILKERDVSASALARMMGFRSRNSIFRLLQDEVSYDKQKEFVDVLKQQKTVPFQEKDWTDLNQALEISRVGVENYWCNRMMNKLIIRNTNHSDEALQIESIQKCGGGGI